MQRAPQTPGERRAGAANDEEGGDGDMTMELMSCGSKAAALLLFWLTLFDLAQTESEGTVRGGRGRAGADLHTCTKERQELD